MNQDWIAKLLELQEKDLRIFKLRRQVAAVPEERREVENLLRQSTDEMERTRQRVIEIEKAIKNLEQQADSLRKKQQDFESKSTMIKDNNEYRAALQQIEVCGHKIIECEDRELELMEDREQARVNLQEERRAHKAMEERTRQMLADLDIREKNCHVQIEKLISERKDLFSSVAAEKVARYERIMQSPSGTAGRPALVPVGNANICGGCHMNVPAQSRVDAINGLLVTCPNCGAMLYYDESAP